MFYCDHSGKVFENDECYQISIKESDTLEEEQQETAIENSKYIEMKFKHHSFGK